MRQLQTISLLVCAFMLGACDRPSENSDGKLPIAKVTVAAGFAPARLDMCKIRSKTFEMDHDMKEMAYEVMAG